MLSVNLPLDLTSEKMINEDMHIKQSQYFYSQYILSMFLKLFASTIFCVKFGISRYSLPPFSSSSIH